MPEPALAVGVFRYETTDACSPARSPCRASTCRTHGSTARSAGYGRQRAGVPCTSRRPDRQASGANGMTWRRWPSHHGDEAAVDGELATGQVARGRRGEEPDHLRDVLSSTRTAERDVELVRTEGRGGPPPRVAPRRPPTPHRLGSVRRRRPRCPAYHPSPALAGHRGHRCAAVRQVLRSYRKARPSPSAWLVRSGPGPGRPAPSSRARVSRGCGSAAM